MLGLVGDGLCQALYAECLFIGLRAVRITAIDGGWRLNIRGDTDDPGPPTLHMKVRNVGVGRIRSSRILVDGQKTMILHQTNVSASLRVVLRS